MKKVDLENIDSPCVFCYIHGHKYSEGSCKSCDHYVIYELLKLILKTYGETCKVCENRVRIGDGYWDCKIMDDTNKCDVDKDFKIDWKAAFEDYI